MKENSIIFMGTTVFSSHILKELIDEGYNIVALVSQPDRKVGRKQEVKATPTKEVALAYNIPVYGFENINDNVDTIKNINPDIIITCAYGQKIGRSILDIPKYRCINVHASRLPKYRGGAPIHYAIMNGESISGNTIMYMEESLDSGDIISMSRVTIDEKDTTSNLHDKLMYDGAKLLLRTLPLIYLNEINPIKQDTTKVVYSPNISKEQEYISFNADVKLVYNKIRSLISVPGPYSMLNNKKIKFHNVFYEGCSHTDVFGCIKVTSNEYFKIACLNGYIIVYQFQLEGKKSTSFKEYSNGNKLEIIDSIIINEGVTK